MGRFCCIIIERLYGRTAMMREIAASKTGNFRGVCPDWIWAAEDFSTVANAMYIAAVWRIGRLTAPAFLMARSDTPGRADKTSSQFGANSAHVQQYEIIRRKTHKWLTKAFASG